MEVKKNRILFRADGGKTIGLGHIVRCLALADMLKTKFEIIFVLQDTAKDVIDLIESKDYSTISIPFIVDYTMDNQNFNKYIQSNDIVVLDGYHFKTDYQKAIKNKGCKLVVIDDLHAWHQVADLIINHANTAKISDYSVEEYTKFALGLDYVLLRSEFLNSTKKPRKLSKVKSVFISMGAADIHNVTQKFTEVLLEISGIEQINLMLSPINPNLVSIKKLANQYPERIKLHFNISANQLVELLENCDLSICPASSISLESSSIGIPIISGYTAENQLDNLAGLTEQKIILNFGNLVTLSKEALKDKIEIAMNQPKLLNELIHNQHKIIDGKSPERLMGLFENFNKTQLHFRFAKNEDVDLYFDWANDEIVRQNSFKQEPINYENHVKWFHSKVDSNSSYLYLFLNMNNEAVGQVRIEKSSEETIIGISIDKNHRGKSLGVEMLQQASSNFFETNPREIINAYIKQENIASYMIFQKAGFRNETLTENTYKLTLSKTSK